MVAGNGTLRAAVSMGWARVAAVDAGDLSPAEARAYGLADNRTAELAGWDIEALRAAVSDLEGTWGRMQDLDLGPADLDRIARELNRRARSGFGGDQPITVAARPEAVDSEPGRLYELGPHRLLCADSTDSVQVARLFEDGARAVLFATDPPYLIGYRGGVGTSPGGRKDWSELTPDPTALDPERAASVRSGMRRGKDWGDVYHEAGEDGDPAGFHVRYGRAVQPHLRDDAAWYCFHADARAEYLARAWADLGVYWHQTIVWTKPTFVLGGTLYHYQHEPCAVGWVRPHMPRRLGEGNESSVWALGWGPDGTAAEERGLPGPSDGEAARCVAHPDAQAHGARRHLLRAVRGIGVATDRRGDAGPRVPGRRDRAGLLRRHPPAVDRVRACRGDRPGPGRAGARRGRGGRGVLAVIYLASPYSHPDPHVREERFREACRHAARLIEEGHDVFSAIAHSHPVATHADDPLPSGWSFWRHVDLPFLARASELRVLRLDGWQASEGVRAEIAWAERMGTPVTYEDPIPLPARDAVHGHDPGGLEDALVRATGSYRPPLTVYGTQAEPDDG